MSRNREIYGSTIDKDAGYRQKPASDILQSGGKLSLSGIMASEELFMLLSALSMYLGTIIVRYVKKHTDPIVATGWHMILGGIPIVVLSLLWESDPVSRLHFNDWMGLSYFATTGNITRVSALMSPV